MIAIWEEKGNLLFPKNITQTSRAAVKPGNLDAKSIALTTREQSGYLAVIKELTKVACVTGILQISIFLHFLIIDHSGK